MLNRFHRLPSLPLLGPGLLTAAHLVTMAALLLFRARTGGYPLQAAGLIIYGGISLPDTWRKTWFLVSKASSKLVKGLKQKQEAIPGN